MASFSFSMMSRPTPRVFLHEIVNHVAGFVGDRAFGQVKFTLLEQAVDDLTARVAVQFITSTRFPRIAADPSRVCRDSQLKVLARHHPARAMSSRALRRRSTS